jgi:hypothetical protein
MTRVRSVVTELLVGYESANLVVFTVQIWTSKWRVYRHKCMRATSRFSTGVNWFLLIMYICLSWYVAFQNDNDYLQEVSFWFLSLKSVDLDCSMSGMLPWYNGQLLGVLHLHFHGKFFPAHISHVAPRLTVNEVTSSNF